MRLCLSCALLVSLSLAGCHPPSAKNTNEAGMPVVAVPAGTAFGDLVVGDPVVHENLTLFPILSKLPKNEDRFITLDEGLGAGTVKILEVGAEVEDGQPTEEEVVVADHELAAEEQALATNVSDDPFGGAPSQVETQAANDDPFGGGATLPREIEAVEDDPFGGDPTAGSDPFGGGEVNTLMVINTSDKPLYLMPGEVIYGGKQNRTIGEELVIQPSDKPTPIDAYCVEQGR